MIAFVAMGILMFLTHDSFHWRPSAPVPVPRAGYAAGVLGDRWIIAGGSYWTAAGKERTSSTEAFDPACDCWFSLPAMPRAVSDAASVTLDGKLYVLGGSDAGGSSSTVYRFDGSQWTGRDEMRLPEPRMSGSAVTAEGRIYIFGGISTAGDYASGLRSVWSIDPNHIAQGWARLPDCPCAPRIAFGAAASDGRLLLFGGYRADGAGPVNLADIWAFDIVRHRWRAAGHLPEGRRALSAVAQRNGVILLGGYTQSFSADILEWNNGMVTRIGTLPFAVADARFALLGNDLYFTGGETAVHVRGSGTWAGHVVASSATEKP